MKHLKAVLSACLLISLCSYATGDDDGSTNKQEEGLGEENIVWTVESGRQDVNLQSPGCVSKKGTIIHVHEQSRPKRDSYVRILFQNIKTDDAYNFEKAARNTVTDFGVTHDYGSVMHNGQYAFSSNQQPTIVPT